MRDQNELNMKEFIHGDIFKVHILYEINVVARLMNNKWIKQKQCYETGKKFLLFFGKNMLLHIFAEPIQ